jgi:hypothetical protein
MPTKKLFCLLIFEGTFTSFFKDKKSERNQKTVGIKVVPLTKLSALKAASAAQRFSYHSCLMIEGSGSLSD